MFCGNMYFFNEIHFLIVLQSVITFSFSSYFMSTFISLRTLIVACLCLALLKSHIYFTSHHKILKLPFFLK